MNFSLGVAPHSTYVCSERIVNVVDEKRLCSHYILEFIIRAHLVPQTCGVGEQTSRHKIILKLE
jgi:hypothetical protein